MVDCSVLDDSSVSEVVDCSVLDDSSVSEVVDCSVSDDSSASEELSSSACCSASAFIAFNCCELNCNSCNRLFISVTSTLMGVEIKPLATSTANPGRSIDCLQLFPPFAQSAIKELISIAPSSNTILPDVGFISPNTSVPRTPMTTSPAFTCIFFAFCLAIFPDTNLKTPLLIVVNIF